MIFGICEFFFNFYIFKQKVPKNLIRDIWPIIHFYKVKDDNNNDNNEYYFPEIIV